MEPMVADASQSMSSHNFTEEYRRWSTEEAFGADIAELRNAGLRIGRDTVVIDKGPSVDLDGIPLAARENDQA